MANGKTMQAVVNLAGSIDPSLGKAIEQAQKKISGLNVKALAVGAAVGGIAVATGKAVVEAGKYMKDLGASFDDAADAIRIGTGATGDALDGLLDDFDAVYKSVPTTMEDASKAIADYNTRLGLTGPQLQEISKQAIQVSDMLGDDLGSVIEESSQAFQQWNIDADDMGGAMDYIFKVSQSTGMGFTDLMADMQKFGPQLQEMGYGWTSVQYRVKAYDAAGAESAYTTSATRTVTNNRPPVISGTDGALGSFSTAAPSYEYTVTDADGHQVDVVEMLDGVTLRSYTVTLGQTNTLTIGSEAWLKVVNGSHTLKIVATDAKDASVTRTLTFTKAVTSVEFEQTLAMEADAMPTKALVNIQGNFPAGCTLQVWICNNGNDASPTWEDITQKARTGQKHYFTNKTKTAAAWGVKVKAKLLRGSATETCYIQSIGGNFA